MVFVRLLTQPPPVPPTGRTFFIELARLLDVPINGNDDMVEVECRIAEALYNRIKNGEQS